MKKCNQCGKCCIKYNGDLGMATQKDLDVWKLNKPEILNYIYSKMMPDIWLDPITGEEVDECPWLMNDNKKEIYSCKIDNFRPEVCRNYPVSINQMKNDKCEMLEPDDFNREDSVLMIELEKIRRSGNK